MVWGCSAAAAGWRFWAPLPHAIFVVAFVAIPRARIIDIHGTFFPLGAHRSACRNIPVDPVNMLFRNPIKLDCPQLQPPRKWAGDAKIGLAMVISAICTCEDCFVALARV